MIDVGRDNHAPACHFIADQLRREPLPPRHIFHLFGSDTLARIVHLREVAIAGPDSFFATFTNPFSSWLGNGAARIDRVNNALRRSAAGAHRRSPPSLKFV